MSGSSLGSAKSGSSVSEPPECCECGETFFHVEAPCLDVDEVQSQFCDGPGSNSGVSFALGCSIGGELSVGFNCFPNEGVIELFWDIFSDECSDGGTVQPTSQSCDPLELTYEFEVPAGCCCQGGSATVTVTVTE